MMVFFSQQHILFYCFPCMELVRALEFFIKQCFGLFGGFWLFFNWLISTSNTSLKFLYVHLKNLSEFFLCKHRYFDLWQIEMLSFSKFIICGYQLFLFKKKQNLLLHKYWKHMNVYFVLLKNIWNRIARPLLKHLQQRQALNVRCKGYFSEAVISSVQRCDSCNFFKTFIH